MLKLGSWQLETVNGGRFWLDAGVMYGIIPKTVWQGVTPPDEQNRIPLGIHCVLAQRRADRPDRYRSWRQAITLGSQCPRN